MSSNPSFDNNSVLHALREGRTVVGGQISTEIRWLAAAFREAGLDFAWIDLEHTLLDLSTVGWHIQACRLAGIPPLVRTPGLDVSLARRLIDNGAQGIVVPFVEDADIAAEAVRACQFHPVGHRGASDPRLARGFRPFSLAEHVAIDASETLVCVQVESRAGVEAAEDIAAVAGLDVVVVGLSDLSVSFGCPGDYDDDEVVAAVHKVIDACAAHGVTVGVGGAYGGANPGERFAAWQEAGARFFSTIIDIPLLAAAIGERAAMMRHALIR